MVSKFSLPVKKLKDERYQYGHDIANGHRGVPYRAELPQPYLVLLPFLEDQVPQAFGVQYHNILLPRKNIQCDKGELSVIMMCICHDIESR